MEHFEVLVLGCGGVGSAALFELARRGVRVLGLDRFPPAHDRGSSHGSTRIIRQAYFEHPDYVPLVQRAYELWTALQQQSSQPLYHEVGLLEVGPPDGIVIPGVLKSARQHQLEIEQLTPHEIEKRWSSFRVPEHLTGVFECRAGYLLVEQCVLAHLEAAQQAGAQLKVGETVRRWQIQGAGVTVETDRATYAADRLIVTAGAWSGTLLAELGGKLTVRRKPFFFLKNQDAQLTVDAGCPTYFYELPAGYFYGFPQIDARGIKVAEHSGGTPVDDPLQVDRTLHPEDYERVATFVRQAFPTASVEISEHAVCLYTLSADENFIVDRHPDHEQVVFAAGLSGHGFKFAPVLGEALADLALTGKTALPIEFLALARPGLITGNKA